ncbi:RNA 2',3'-cyclic phosphodiesterase, partial [Candidatus Pacearchaeota archaeon]
MRTFISIDIPEKVRKEIIKIQNELSDFKGKKTEPENLHLTLKF